MKALATFAKLLPPILSLVLIGAHFLRYGNYGLLLVSLAFPFLLLLKRKWVAYIFRIVLILASLFWLAIGMEIVGIRSAHGLPYLRLAAIMLAVALFTAASALVFRFASIKERYGGCKESALVSAASFILVAAALSFVQLKLTAPPLLLLERFIPSLGWLEVLIASAYAAILAEQIQNPKLVPRWRVRVWLAFSIFFFSQFFIGISGVEQMLMTGKLHIPVPAVIVAGPLYRAQGFFMPVLFLSTIVLVGPAWCSWLCYFGAWDGFAASTMKKPSPPFGRYQHLRIAILVAVVALALGFRWFGVSDFRAAVFAVSFGVIGLLVMAFYSRKTGMMAHCIAYCPIGILSITLGKISPFRVRITPACTDCGACTRACRYDALRTDDIQRRKPGINCTLCGDCLGACPRLSIEYRFPGLSGNTARALFIALAVSLHAVFFVLAMV